MKSMQTGTIRINYPDSWTYLKVLESIQSTTFAQSRNLDDIESNALDEMQKMFPGNYTVKALYDVDTHTVKFKLVFNSPRDETFFKLKYE